jgi:hypothetical protein
VTTYEWLCGCGVSGKGEKAAATHAQTCTLMGYPKGYHLTTHKGGSRDDRPRPDPPDRSG